MTTIGVIKTDDGPEFFAVLGEWCSSRSYPGREGLNRACAEAAAYQEWLLEFGIQEFDLFWEEYWRSHREYWTRRQLTELWNEVKSEDFLLAVEWLAQNGLGLTYSPLAEPAKRYSCVRWGGCIRKEQFDKPSAVTDFMSGANSAEP